MWSNNEWKLTLFVIKVLNFTLKFSYIKNIFQLNPYIDSTMGSKTSGLKATIHNKTWFIIPVTTPNANIFGSQVLAVSKSFITNIQVKIVIL